MARGDDLDCYTLLADDSSAFANDPDHRRGFKAHIVLNVILNDGIVFSDNQIICSENLRSLTRVDGLVQELFKAGRFGVATRMGFEDDPTRLITMDALLEAFRREGKIRPDAAAYTDSPELSFVERHAVTLPWTYDAVRRSFTQTCEGMIRDHFGRTLSQRHFDVFWTLIEQERAREGDGGLGRAFLQMRLPEQMQKAGLAVDDGVRAALKRCTDAPYVSNLPRTIGLNPIYSSEHAESFELLRGTRMEFQDVEEPVPVGMKLDHAHFVEGINGLDVDDVETLRTCVERKVYRQACADLARNPSRLHDVAVFYGELNRRIEDQILSRRPELRVSTARPEPCRVRKMAARALDYGMSAVDCLAINWDVLGPQKIAAVMGAKVVMDMLKAGVEGAGPGRRHHDAARHDVEMKSLASYLHARGLGERLTIEETIVRTASFDKEIIVS